MRGLILLTLVVFLAVTIVPTLRNLLDQRSQASQLQETVATQQQQLAELTREAELWKDPEYIQTQARARLQFVKVGDRAYTVLGAGQTDLQRQLAPTVAAAGADASAPWFDRVWQSVALADQPVAQEPASEANTGNPSPGATAPVTPSAGAGTPGTPATPAPSAGTPTPSASGASATTR